MDSKEKVCPTSLPTKGILLAPLLCGKRGRVCLLPIFGLQVCFALCPLAFQGIGQGFWPGINFG